MPYSERVVAGARSSVLFIGKRFYTNRDALTERYGRIYQLPHLWAEDGVSTRLWLVDYKTRETRRQRLLAQGLTEAQLSRLHAPIGLPIGTRTPEEIALATMAQIVASRSQENGR